MGDIRNYDKLGLVAEKRELYFACYRLIRPGQTYYLTIENIVHCKDCALSEGLIRVREGLAVEVKRDRPAIFSWIVGSRRIGAQPTGRIH